MKENMELERKDLVIDRDMEVDCDIGQQITCYIETWFDVDEKFRIKTDSENGTWLNMYGKYDPFADTLRIECVISGDDFSDTFDYQPTAAETQLMCAKHLLWLHGAEGEQADFSNCLLRDLNLSNRNLESAVFDGAKLVNTPLYASNISYSSFSGTRFYRCELSRMKAENAMFPDAFFHSCEITTTAYVECNFSRATFSESNVGGSMHQCCIDGTNFGNEANGRPDLIQCSDDEESWAEDMHCSASVSM